MSTTPSVFDRRPATLGPRPTSTATLDLVLGWGVPRALDSLVRSLDRATAPGFAVLWASTSRGPVAFVTGAPPGFSPRDPGDHAGAVQSLPVRDRVGRTVGRLDLYGTVPGSAAEAVRGAAHIAGFLLAADESSTTDQLTGLGGRRAFERRLAAGGFGGLVAIDLDGFRTVNEALGHDFADQALVGCARRLEARLEPGDSLWRLGDDEFVAVLAANASPASWADAALDALRLPIVIEGRRHSLTASFGVVVVDDDSGLEPGNLLGAADGALDRAKARGGNRVELADPLLQTKARRRVELEQGLRWALDARQFRLHYQGQVSMATGGISGVEALVRWEHPEHGLVHPAAFIPVAEESGLINPIGAFVLNQACADAHHLIEAQRPDGPFTVSVNVSTVQLREPGFVDLVAETLDRSGLAPSHLCLELTESAILDDSIRIDSTLEALRDLGVSLSIDDFGTGYSALSYLRRLPITELKIDRSFIVAMTDEPGRRMVRAICGLAEALELETVAEGVETNEELALLREWGCDVIQGYLYFKPQALDRMLKAIRRDRPRRFQGAT